MLEQIVKQFKALGEPTRLKIVKLLQDKELCVCELEALLEMNQPRISQHLKVLKEAGLVKERKIKQWSYVSLNALLSDGKLSGFEHFMGTPLANIEDLSAESQRLQVWQEVKCAIGCSECDCK
ncbi:MAG: ArsR/SmtB family transcription factor [Deltaproteobacteria bacterium]